MSSEEDGAGRVDGTSCTTEGSRLKDVKTILRMGRGIVVVVVDESEGWRIQVVSREEWYGLVVVQRCVVVK